LARRYTDTNVKEPLPDPTLAELAKEAQDEARVFAAQGLIVNLQRMLDRLDPSRGDRIEDNPEIEELYRRTVEVQPEIVGLMKKYSDQKGRGATRST
jgi:signal transducing adaptor molecule